MHFTKYTMTGFLLFLMISACNDRRPEQTSPLEKITSKTTIDTVNIIHAVLPVQVPVKGYLEYWKKKTIFSSDTSQIISVLVEDGQQVYQNEYLLSLWELQSSKEYTPVDVRAPFEGIIEKVFVKIGSKIGQNEPLLHIHNNDFLSMHIEMHKDQLKFLRKNQKVVQDSPPFKWEGFIELVDKKSNFITILVKNDRNKETPMNMVSLKITCGKIKGDFIASDKFNNNKITAYIDDESSFIINRIGISDSLSLISPGLPHLSKISVVSHKY